MPANNGFESDLQNEEAAPAEIPADIDFDELAKKVFELLLQELEIENDRIGKY